MVHFDELYSDRAGKMRKSEIRELLKVTEDPEIISFAGGLPNPQSFPIQDLKGIVQTVLNQHGKVALQYGPTQGIKELRELIAERSIRESMKGGVALENIMITSGSQQALDAVGKIFLNPGDIALVGLPSYLGGINAFRSYEANLIGIPLDKEGMRMDLLEEKIKELLKQDLPVKFIYAIPTFQNPAGTVMPESRRKKLVDIAHEYNLIIIEDFSQYIAHEFIKNGSLDLHIMKICEMYKPKRDIMMDSMEKYFPEGYICNKPKGGMFAWVTLPEQIDTEAMFLDAFKEKVAYVHGKAFCVDGGGGSSMRLNFSYSTNEQLETGMKRLGTVIERKMKVLCH